MSNKRIMSALTAGLICGSIVAVPVSSYAAEATTVMESTGDYTVSPHPENVKPGAVEFRPNGWDEDGFVAIWKNRPYDGPQGEYALYTGAYYKNDKKTRASGYYDGVLRSTDVEGFQFDIIDYDDEGNPNTFLVYYGVYTIDSYECRVTVKDHDTVVIEWLKPCGEEWTRKKDNYAYEVSAPVVEKVSSERPYPVETYTFRKISSGEAAKIQENVSWLFVSDHGVYSAAGRNRGYLSIGSHGPMAAALIAFWEAGGEVELYPEDASQVTNYAT